MARWQRERRQQAIVLTSFSAVLLFVLGLVAWGASDRYYETNLEAAAVVDGKTIPMREFRREVEFDVIKFYVDFGVGKELENDPRVLQQKNQYEDPGIERAVEHRILDALARRESIAISETAISDQYALSFGQFNARHILVAIEKDPADKELADLNAQAKARAIANELREAPQDQALWNRLAQERSDDPGSKFGGGDLGFTGTGQFVEEFESAIRTLPIGAISDPVKTQFGYHVIQLRGRRAPAETELIQRYLSSAWTEAELRERVRLDLLRKEFTKRAEEKAPASPAEQVHLAKIVVNTPPPTAGDFQAFSEGLKKLSDVKGELDKGTDFAEVAKKYSDDGETREKGGEVGWILRGMNTDLRAEEEIFSKQAGERTREFIGQIQTIVYKVLEKDPAREVTDEQKKSVKDQAYRYWFQQQKRTFGVRKLITGLSLE